MAPGDGARRRWRIDGCGVVGPRSTRREKRGPEVQAGAEGVLCLHLRGQANQTTKAKSWRTPNGGRIRIALASFSKVAFLSGVSLPGGHRCFNRAGRSASAMRSATESRERLHYS